MRIPDDLLTCPVFFGGRDSEGQLHYRATAFLVSYPVEQHELGAWALVTARHNVLKSQREYGNVWVRLNTPDGGAQDMEITAPWICPDDPAVDIAAVPFPFPGFFFEAIPLPLRWFVTDEVIQKRLVGIGEELLALGLFARHVGKTRNLPIIRSGVLASMPLESLVDPATGEPFQAYLAEVRSIGGLSGSPVFLALNPSTRYITPDQVTEIAPEEREAVVEGRWFYLLGLIRGHWNTEVEADYQESEFDRLNTGIAMVTPITELLPLLEREEFVAHGKEVDKRLAQADAEGMVEDWDAEPSEGDSEFGRFERLTKQLVDTPKPKPDEEDSSSG